ncbi:MAG: HAMP domain-containing protein [Gemmataceae bacterium]|nr:HAMP domain-containing protein [Gemmataceae bacterium]
MSYRAFKRLFGETSLERKCRFLFGAGILVLITLSFLLYAWQTEYLAYEQAAVTCRLLVTPILQQEHQTFLRNQSPKGDAKIPGFVLNLEASIPLQEPGREYQWTFLREPQFQFGHERDLYKEFLKDDPDKMEDTRLLPTEHVLLYYAPIRAAKGCMSCHQQLAQDKGLGTIAENDLLGMLRLRMSTRSIEEGVHWNRALLMAVALATAILIMTGSWIIVRYIIVKPVKHLKEVSDAISQGELNVRSEIQTGDEFEDLSHAFNRMLRSLVAMQDHLRKANGDLDRKVDELAQANLALYESNRLKSDFLATVSHELRTPLNSILGFSDVLLTSDSLADKQQRWVGNIQTSGKRLLNLIEDILDLAKIEAGKMQVKLTEFSLQDMCEGLLTMFRPLAEKKNIDVRSQIDPGIPSLRQDQTKFQQILENLLSNAVKFTPEGGRVWLRGETDGRFLVLTVSDTGVGIAPEEQELVFQKFRQSGSTMTRQHSGTGLGLSIVRELAKLLGGEVGLQSELGRGSTFTVRLPLQLSEEPRLEFDLASESVDLTKAQRVDVRMFASAPTRLDRGSDTILDRGVVEPLTPNSSPQKGEGNRGAPAADNASAGAASKPLQGTTE